MVDLQGVAADEWPEDRVDIMQEHDLEGVPRSSQQQTICKGLFWELNPGPLVPLARIMPLDQKAK